MSDGPFPDGQRATLKQLLYNGLSFLSTVNDFGINGLKWLPFCLLNILQFFHCISFLYQFNLPLILTSLVDFAYV